MDARRRGFERSGSGDVTGDVVVSQLGARMHYAVPRILAGAGRLAHFYTDIYATPRLRRLLSLVPQNRLSPALRRLAGRIPEQVPAELITSFPVFAMRSGMVRLRIRNDIEITRHAVWAGAGFPNSSRAADSAMRPAFTRSQATARSS